METKTDDWASFARASCLGGVTAERQNTEGRLTRLTASSEAAAVTAWHSHILMRLSDAVSISSGSVE